MIVCSIRPDLTESRCITSLVTVISYLPIITLISASDLKHGNEDV